MAIFVIAYDLVREPASDYKLVHERITSISNDWVHIQLSTFVVNSNMSAYEIRNYLSTVFRKDEKLIVAQLGSQIAGLHKFNDQVADWFTRNGFPSSSEQII